jgi:hypothetical protein
MKSITKILGGAQMLLGLTFDIQECAEVFSGRSCEKTLIGPAWQSVNADVPEKTRGDRKRNSNALPGRSSRRSDKALSEIELPCAWGCKKNSQGNVAFWRELWR